MKAPSYRLHKATGQARVTINGKTFYLGEHGSDKSKQRYKQVLADHWDATGKTPKIQPAKVDEVVTVAKLAIEFAKASIKKHGEDSNEWKYQVRPVLKEIRSLTRSMTASPTQRNPRKVRRFVAHLYCQ